MKRRIVMALCAVLLLGLCACGLAAVADEEPAPVQPVNFYYQAAAGDFSGGAIQAEVRDLGPETLPAEEILELYFRGPVSEGLRSPFPADLAVDYVSLSDGVLTLAFNDAYASLSGVQLTLANACLVYTLVQFEGIESVCLQTTGSMLSGQLSVPLEAEDFLLLDDSAINDQTTVKLYFSDENGRYLVEETRSRFFTSESDIPAYVLQQLLAGPQGDHALAALPEGTSLLGVQVEGGLCTVNFSEEFLLNRPQSYEQARMAVFSVVNSLTELPEIESVRILCAGESVERGYFLDLTKALYRDEAVLAGQISSGSFDANLYVVLNGQEILATAPTYVRRSDSRVLAMDVLNALIAFKGLNGYENPIPNGALVVDLTVEEGLCQVTFNSSFALCDTDEATATQAVRAVVATLCALDGIDRVQIQVYNSELTHVDLSEPWTSDPAWVLE